MEGLVLSDRLCNLHVPTTMVKNGEYSGNMRISCSTLRVEKENCEDLTIQQFANFSLIFLFSLVLRNPDAMTRGESILGEGEIVFLDATTHLYNRSCPSVRRSVRQSVRTALFSNIENRSF